MKKSDQGMMEREVFEKLLEVFTPGGTLALFGRGETLMHPDFSEFLKLAKQSGMKVGFNSNGKSLNKEIARAMVEYGQDYITISCSAGSPQTYKTIHQGGKWDQTWSNIAGLQRAKKEYGVGSPSIYLEFVAQRDNIRELPALVRRAIEWELTGIMVIDIVAHSNDLEKQRMNMPDTLPIADRYYGEALKVVEEYRHQNPHFDLRLPSAYDALSKKFALDKSAEQLKQLNEKLEQSHGCSVNKNMCLEPWQTFYVRFNGQVAPCVITNRNLGDLNSQGALEIWNGQGFQRFRERMRSENKPFECLRCHLFPGPQRYDKMLDDATKYEPL